MMLAAQEFDAPRLSTTVRTTRLVPLGYGPAGIKARPEMVPSGSTEPLSTAAADTSAWQPAPALVITLRHWATGGILVEPALVWRLNFVRAAKYDEPSTPGKLSVSRVTMRLNVRCSSKGWPAGTTPAGMIALVARPWSAPDFPKSGVE